MDPSLAQRILTKIALAIFVIAILDLVYLNWWILKTQNSNVKTQISSTNGNIQTEVPSPSPESLPSPGPSPTLESTSQVSNVETKTVIEKQTQTIIQTSQKEIFIPMGGGSTNSNTFSDLTGTDVTIDTAKYLQIDSVVFEASVRVEGGNGRAYAQVLNVDDKTPYIESQISNATGSPTVKTSGKIPIPSGKKTYRVQAKTDITNFAAHVDNARMKITLK